MKHTPKQEQVTYHVEKVQDIQKKWDAFLLSLEEEGESLIASALQKTVVTITEGNRVRMEAVSKLSYDLLRDSLGLIYPKAETFFGTKVLFEIDLGEMEKMEESVLVRFQKLAKENEVIKYLIDEFGIEPFY